MAEAVGAHRYSGATVQTLQGHKALHLKEGGLSDRNDENGWPPSSHFELHGAMFLMAGLK